MYITIITDDYNDDIASNNCRNNDTIIEKKIPLFTNNPMWNVTYMFNNINGVYYSQAFIQ